MNPEPMFFRTRKTYIEGASVIVAWAFLFRRILLLDQRIRIFGGAVVMWS
jgi:hypothetical protein